MGLNIYTNVNFNETITASEWERVWKESLHLLGQFPAPLIRIVEENSGPHTRLVFSRGIRSEAGKKEEHWHTVGDEVSKERAESFLLYRHLSHYQQERGNYRKDKDVLWNDEGRLHCIDCNGIEVFGSKTQGRPYHLAILAVGMLLESRFPGCACVNGDIERRQAEWMLAWANEHLSRPIGMPVCFDAEQLWTRLLAAHDNQEQLALEQFDTLYRGPEEEKMEALFRLAGKEPVMKKWSKNLAAYKSLDQWGASVLVCKLVNATKDLQEVINAVLQVKPAGDKKAFSLKSLLELLCRSFITLDFQEREALRSMHREEGQLMTMDGVIGHIFAKLSGLPDEVNIYVPASELLDLFATLEPDKRAVFKKIIEDYTAEYRESLSPLSQVPDGPADGPVPPENPATILQAEVPLILSTPPTMPARPVSEAEQYIMQQVDAQRGRFQGAEEIAQTIGEQFHKAIRKNGNNPRSVFSINDPAEIRYAIWDAATETGFALHETAWAAIDAEEDLFVLKTLLALASVDTQEINFWNWRLHIMESPVLWRFFKDGLPAAGNGKGKKKSKK